jgi:hypothetical protein
VDRPVHPRTVHTNPGAESLYKSRQRLHWFCHLLTGAIRVSHFISFVRVPALAVRQYLRPLPHLDVLGEDALDMRVLPNDIDLNFHMNNARYLALMDYGRTHLLARTRLLGHIVRSRWQPLLGAAWVTYRRSLPLFTRVRMTSRVGWVKGILRNAQGTVDPQQVIEAVAPGLASPPMPETMLDWNELTREKLNNGAS